MSSFERCVVLVVDDEPTVLKTVTYAPRAGWADERYASVSSGDALSI
jgi:hypothetical protein